MAVSAAERILPHSTDAEQWVLGAVLVDPKAWAVAASVLSAADFYRDAHQRIFRAMLALVESGQPIDFGLLREQLSNDGNLDEVGGPAYVAALADGMPRAANVEYYARIVREKARLRAIIYAANAATALAYEGEPSAEVAERVIRDVSATVDAGSGMVTGDAAVQAYVTAALSDSPMAVVRSGYVDLDALTGGFKLGDLVVVAARPSVGKTAFALCAAEHIATTGAVVPFFSLEMGQHGIGGRLLALRSHVGTAQIEARSMSERQYARVAAAMEATGRPLLLEMGSKTVVQIEAWCRRLKQQGAGLTCMVVDYLQLLAPDRARENESADVTAVSRALKRLATDLNIVVIALSQLSRAPEGRRDKRPQLADLRGSGAIEQDTDTAILLYREEMHAPDETNRGIAEAIVAKQRNGPTGVVRLCFLAELAMFTNLAGESVL